MRLRAWGKLNPLANAEHQLRNGWWIVAFFLVLASMLVPALVVARQQGGDVSLIQQAAIIAIASWVCQRAVRPWTWGRPGGRLRTSRVEVPFCVDGRARPGS